MLVHLPLHTPRPRRRGASLLAGAILAAVALGPGCGRGGGPAVAAGDGERPPDIVLVVVDTWRADSTGFGGNPRPTTPRLDELARQATWFSRAYSFSSWTLQSMVGLLTGMYPWQHTVALVGPDEVTFGRLPPGSPTLAATLRERGYRTAAFVNNSLLAPHFGLDQGFDLYDYQGAPPVGHRTAAETVARALDWLGEGSDAADGARRPALLLIHVQEPHVEYMPPEPFAGTFSAGMPHAIELPLGEHRVTEMRHRRLVPPAQDQAYLRALYDEEVLATDAAIGALLDGLSARPGWEDTVVVITGDHGEELWDEGGFEHGHTTRSILTRVPLLVRAPGVVPGENRTVVSHADLVRWLTGEDDALLDIARSGTLHAGRTAISEGVLYGPPEVSIVGDERRLVIYMYDDGKRASLWGIDEDGRDVIDLSSDPSLGDTLQRRLVAARGSLDASVAIDAITLDPEVRDHLEALGYLE